MPLIAGAAMLGLLVGCKPRGNAPANEEEKGGDIQLDPAAERPKLEFPKNVQTDDAALNGFIVDFYETCCRGKYDKFRLMMSSRVDPFTPERFKRSLVAVERIEIEAVERLPDVTEIPPPVYVVRSRVRIRPSAQKGNAEKALRTITILVFKEAGRWVMAPAPKGLAKELDLLTTQESEPGDTPRPVNRTDQP